LQKIFETLVEGGIVAACRAIDFPRKGKARGGGVARGGEEGDTAQAGFDGGLSGLREFAGSDCQRAEQ
jgi:hypothetical protein